MKFKLPAFLEGLESPIEGEVAMRGFAASEIGANAVVVGIDEVGRGPLAGPVVACAAVLKAPDVMAALNDSKKLTRAKREAMYQEVQDACMALVQNVFSTDAINTAMTEGTYSETTTIAGHTAEMTLEIDAEAMTIDVTFFYMP